MSNSFHHEYLELLRGAREHLLSQYPKGSFILAERDNWEALRRSLSTAAKPIAQQVQRKPAPIAPSPQPHFNKAVISSTPVVKEIPKQEPKTETAAQPAPKRVVEEKVNRSLSLTERPPANTVDLASWKEIFIEKFPQIQLIEPTPTTTSKATQVSIVYEKANPQELAFLQNIARTCHMLLGNTRLVRLNQFVPDSQKMVICYGITVENGFPLEPFTTYLQNPKLKAQLWRQLCSQFMQKSS